MARKGKSTSQLKNFDALPKFAGVLTILFKIDYFKINKKNDDCRSGRN